MILHVELLLRLRLIDILLQLQNLLVVLVSFFSIFILGLLEFFIQPLDFLIEVLLLNAKPVELPLSLETVLDVSPVLRERKLSQLGVELLQLLDQVVFIGLDFLLIAINIGVVLQLTAQSAGRLFQILGHTL